MYYLFIYSTYIYLYTACTAFGGSGTPPWFCILKDPSVVSFLGMSSESVFHPSDVSLPPKLVRLQRRFINHLDNENLWKFLVFKTTCHELLQFLSCSWWAYSDPILFVQVGSHVKRRVLSPLALLQLQGLQAARALNVAVAPPPGSPWRVLPVKPAEPVALELHVERRARPRTLPAPRPAVAERLDLRQYGGSCCAEPCVSGGRHKRWGELPVLFVIREDWACCGRFPVWPVAFSECNFEMIGLTTGRLFLLNIQCLHEGDTEGNHPLLRMVTLHKITRHKAIPARHPTTWNME